MSWKEMQPEIVQHIESDRAGSTLLKLVLFIVIGFGILAVVMMMVSERKKEMGVMVAVGMQKKTLAMLLLSETFIIGLLGLAAGVIAGIPLIWYQSVHPIPLTGKTGSMIRDFGFEPYLFFSTSARVFINQVLILLIMMLAVAAYPVVIAMNFNHSKAFKK
jgi:ABC-type lipoprotein release transport system permease subunit